MEFKFYPPTVRVIGFFKFNYSLHFHCFILCKWMLRLVCGCGLHELTVAVSFHVTVSKHQWKIHHAKLGNAVIVTGLGDVNLSSGIAKTISLITTLSCNRLCCVGNTLPGMLLLLLFGFDYKLAAVLFQGVWRIMRQPFVIYKFSI